MKTDELFHEYFKLAPQAFFDLFQLEPGCPYKFSSPVVKKATKRRIDGVLEPTEPGHPTYFLEVQGYYDPDIYWRALQQITLYLGHKPEVRQSGWRAAFLFLDPAYDPGPESLGTLYQPGADWLWRGYLPQLVQQVPPARSVVLNVLRPLAATEATARREASRWRASLQQATAFTEAEQQELVDILTQFMFQKFKDLSVKEIATMLKLTPIEETRAGRELYERGKKDGHQEGRQKGRQEGRQEGQQEGRQEGIQISILQLLEIRFGQVAEEITVQVKQVEDRERLHQLLQQAATAASLAAFGDYLG